MDSWFTTIVDFVKGWPIMVHIFVVGILFILGAMQFKTVIKKHYNNDKLKLKIIPIILMILCFGLAIFFASIW